MFKLTLSIFVRFSKISCQNLNQGYFYQIKYNLFTYLVSKLNNISTNLCSLGHEKFTVLFRRVIFPFGNLPVGSIYSSDCQIHIDE